MKRLPNPLLHQLASAMGNGDTMMNAMAVAGAVIVVVSVIVWRFHSRRRPEQEFEFVYVNQDGSARELSPDERVYLSTEFSGGDGARPFIKERYEDRDGWGSQSGFIRRRLVPSGIPIEPVHPNYDALEKQLGHDLMDAFRVSGFTATNADASIPCTPETTISQKERFERSRNHHLAAQRRREELARTKHGHG